MKLTALEIKQQTFARSLRGYDVAEVQSFLNVVSSEWEHLFTRCKDQEHEIQRLNEKLQHYQKVEEALHETLQAAKESSEQRISSSREEAQNRIAKADLEAEKIVRDAQEERQAIRRSIQRLLERRHEIIRGMESYLELATESLDSFKKDPNAIFSLPGEEEKGGENTRASGSANKKSDDSGRESITGSASSVPGGEDIDELLDDLDD